MVIIMSSDVIIFIHVSFNYNSHYKIVLVVVFLCNYKADTINKVSLKSILQRKFAYRRRKFVVKNLLSYHGGFLLFINLSINTITTPIKRKVWQCYSELKGYTHTLNSLNCTCWSKTYPWPLMIRHDYVVSFFIIFRPKILSWS
jgi:hypothetical protein